MFKIRVLIVLVFISAISFAQIMKMEKSPLLKVDSLRSKIDFKPFKDSITSNLFQGQNSTTKFVMPNAKPKKDSLYAALKGKKRDDSIYNIPNVIDKKIVLVKK